MNFKFKRGSFHKYITCLQNKLYWNKGHPHLYTIACDRVLGSHKHGLEKNKNTEKYLLYGCDKSKPILNMINYNINKFIHYRVLLLKISPRTKLIDYLNVLNKLNIAKTNK